MKGSDVRKIIADAAQRRIEVTEGCASGSNDSEKLAEEASRNGFSTKAEEDDADERAIMQVYIEMIQEEEREKYGSSYVPPSQENPAGPRRNVYPKKVRLPSMPVQMKPLRRFASSGTLSGSPSGSGQTSPNRELGEERPWNCQICTLENPPEYLCCDACGTERPASALTSQSRLVRTSSREDLTKKETSKPRSRLAFEVITGDASRVLSFKGKTSEAIAGLEDKRAKKPLGWLCHVCGAFMETEWWTCSACGTMKSAS